MPHGFDAYPVAVEGNLFEELAAATRFEGVGKGRLGAVLVRPDASGDVPLVRTTTRYGTPAQRFGPVHERLVRHLPGPGGNNALVERYTNAYTTMGAHSDQALDLADGSSIAVFSCYRYPEAGPPRMLLVEPKEPGDTVRIPLAHHSVVTFCVDTNRRFRHRIVLAGPAESVDNEWSADNEWLGVTVRTSRTFVRFRDGRPHFADGTRLTAADEDQRREFYRLRRRENLEPDFRYPRLTYTVSDSDLMPPVGHAGVTNC